jgi:hypothetical protein
MERPVACGAGLAKIIEVSEQLGLSKAMIYRLLARYRKNLAPSELLPRREGRAAGLGRLGDEDPRQSQGLVDALSKNELRWPHCNHRYGWLPTLRKCAKAGDAEPIDEPDQRALRGFGASEMHDLDGEVPGVENHLDQLRGFFARDAPLYIHRPRARWADIDLDAAEWRFTVSKTNTKHIVPLARQAVEILRELYPLTGRGQFVFPGARTNSRPMSDNAILAALRRIGIDKDEMSGHGFRAVARTILDEVLGVRPDFIEHQLAHAVRDPNGRAYNRTASSA